MRLSVAVRRESWADASPPMCSACSMTSGNASTGSGTDSSLLQCRPSMRVEIVSGGVHHFYETSEEKGEMARGIPTE